ncbi:GNAT family N-acetyltransferase [Paenibacillus sacheonensis]|uniref:GNAT family N-acetyltransferase n=1 Tax=Paenibacillus sacheonensis TaxID=742054 RepID=A0A7X5C016_9BACL|nr:GNAT family protein [Paenibacillus sacheonensis]MBM7563688.1 ribosomal-protein-alanine N-acetyltransferase [Paenibacillus sacheonensis]NBC67954.1 GNAT family N-acetyltransferase [Paenibacillus sacheonensis]
MIPGHEWHRLKIQTQRLRLQVIDESCTERALAFVTRNRESLAEWEPSREDDYFTAEIQRELIVQDIHSMANGHGVRLWVTAADAPDGDFIGTVSLNNIVRGAFQSCHLGYRMDHRHRNKGYMTEALSHVVAFAFGRLNLHRIEANVMPRNAASLKVCERLGFHHEGLARDYLRIGGKWEDHIHMVLLNSSWTAAQASGS